MYFVISNSYYTGNNTEDYCEQEITIRAFIQFSYIIFLIIRIHPPSFTVSKKCSFLAQDYVTIKWLSRSFIINSVFSECTHSYFHD